MQLRGARREPAGAARPIRHHRLTALLPTAPSQHPRVAGTKVYHHWRCEGPQEELFCMTVGWEGRRALGEAMGRCRCTRALWTTGGVRTRRRCSWIRRGSSVALQWTVGMYGDCSCSVDRYLLQHLDYAGDMEAGQESHVFKSPTSPRLSIPPPFLALA